MAHDLNKLTIRYIRSKFRFNTRRQLYVLKPVQCQSNQNITRISVRVSIALSHKFTIEYLNKHTIQWRIVLSKTWRRVRSCGTLYLYADAFRRKRGLEEQTDSKASLSKQLTTVFSVVHLSDLCTHSRVIKIYYKLYYHIWS